MLVHEESSVVVLKIIHTNKHKDDVRIEEIGQWFLHIMTSKHCYLTYRALSDCVMQLIQANVKINHIQ